MTWMYALGSVVAVGLLIYLVAALLAPEKFS
jgi:K+-transporting ATPase KdpF subunit